jgi:hypothetical protein
VKVNDWNEPDSIPSVAKGTEDLFWVAVDSRHSGKVHVFMAYYQNRPLEYHEDGVLVDDALYDTNGDPVDSVGWVDCKEHYEFDDYYTPLSFDDDYKLLGWKECLVPVYEL